MSIFTRQDGTTRLKNVSIPNLGYQTGNHDGGLIVRFGAPKATKWGTKAQMDVDGDDGPPYFLKDLQDYPQTLAVITAAATGDWVRVVAVDQSEDAITIEDANGNPVLPGAGPTPPAPGASFPTSSTEAPSGGTRRHRPATPGFDAAGVAKEAASNFRHMLEEVIYHMDAALDETGSDREWAMEDYRTVAIHLSIQRFG